MFPISKFKNIKVSFHIAKLTQTNCKQTANVKIVGAQRTMYQGLWGIELSMRRILGVRYPKEKPQNGISFLKF